VRSCHSPPRPGPSTAVVPAHLQLASGRPSRGDVRTRSRARALWMLSSVAGPAVASGVAPVVENTLQCERPMQTAIMCAYNGPKRADSRAPRPVQRCAALGYVAAVLRSAVGASTSARAWAMGSERLSTPLLHACACSGRTPPRTSRRGAARAQRCCDRAAPGRCGDVAQRRTGRTRTARAKLPL
jgi:hypothetical protein